MRRLIPPPARLLPALGGLLLVVASPPYDWYILAWVGLAPLFIALETTEGSGFSEGFISGLVFNAGIVYWLAFNSGTYLSVAALTMILATAILSLSWGTAAWLFLKLRHRIGFQAWFVVPFAWVTWEAWLAHLGELAFPWPLLALTQAGFNPLLQIMEFTGEAGVSFWVAAVNVVLFILLRTVSKPVRLVAATCIPILALIPVIASLHATKFMQQNRDSINVLAVQGNVAAHEKWIRGTQYSWTIYDSLMHAVEPGSFQLAVWPETALPTHLVYQNQFAGSFTALSDELNVWILTGASDYHRLNDEHLPLNAAFLAGPDRGIMEKCAKRHLVPFGERVPFQFIYPDLRKLNFGQAEFLPGLRPTVFEVEAGGKSARFPVMICYESIFSWIARSAVQRGANLLITISNDAWYGRSPEAEQIAALSRMRCIECRRAMVRAANTGISLLIDPLGREIKRTGQFQEAFTGGEIPLCEELTFYVRHGDVCAGFATLVFGIVLLGATLKREAA